jgi:flagellar hook-length control protein FliK
MPFPKAIETPYQTSGSTAPAGSGTPDTPPNNSIHSTPGVTSQNILLETGVVPAQSATQSNKAAGTSLAALTTRQSADQSADRKLPLIEAENLKTELVTYQAKEIAGQTAKQSAADFEAPDNQTLPVIKQQLEILNNGQFVWQGEAWRGQNLEWTISKEPPQKHLRKARGWNTELRFDLPKLGAIGATFKLTGNQLTLSFSAASTSTAEKMNANSEEHINALKNSGMELSGVEVRHDPSL